MPDNSVFYCPPDEAARTPPPWPDGCPQPGLYRDVPYEDYAAWPAVNATALKHGAELSPKHMRQTIIGSDDSDTKARKFGRGIHCRLLEGKPAFLERFIIAKACCQPLKSGERKGEPCGLTGGMMDDAGNWYCGKHVPKDRETATPKDYTSEAEADALEQMVQAVYAHPSVALMRQHGGCEVSLVWERDGFPCKARLDKLIVDANCPDTVLDLKKLRAFHIGPESINKQIADYYYDLSAAWYVDGVKRVLGKDAAFLWIFCEDGPPWDVCVKRFNKRWQQIGKIRAETAFRSYVHCVQTGIWPGVADDIDDGPPPAWLCKRYGVT